MMMLTLSATPFFACETNTLNDYAVDTFVKFGFI